MPNENDVLHEYYEFTLDEIGRLDIIWQKEICSKRFEKKMIIVFFLSLKKK